MGSLISFESSLGLRGEEFRVRGKRCEGSIAPGSHLWAAQTLDVSQSHLHNHI